MIDLFLVLVFGIWGYREALYIPCKVNVIDCSSFSSSSVKDRLLDEEAARDILHINKLNLMRGILSVEFERRDAI